VSALAAPIAVSPELIRTDMWWMIRTALLLLPLIRTRVTLSRGEGGLLLAVYCVYLTVLLMS
jgi:cation:H+ antiporter